MGALLVGCALLAPACRATSGGRSEPQLFFTEAGAAPVGVDGQGPNYDGDVLSLGLDTLGSPVSVTRVTPVADPGLKATYLGWSTCARGCAGAQHWDETGQRLVRNGLDGRYPVQVRAGLRPSLIFLLQARGVGVDRVNHQCLIMRAVRVHLANGREQTVLARTGGWVGAIQLYDTDRPPNYRTCEFKKPSAQG